MKKYLLSALFVCATVSFAWACRCFPSNGFCDDVERLTKRNPQTVVVLRAKIMKKTGENALLSVEKVYWGSEKRQTIRCFQGGSLCGSIGLGNEGETFIYILWRIEKLFSSLQSDMEIGDYQTIECQFDKLTVKNGQISGRITSRTEQTIEDNDPDILNFCSNLPDAATQLNSAVILPNPAVNQLIIKGLERPVEVLFFDTVGRLMLKTLFIPAENFISVADLPKGLYIVRLNLNTQFRIFKVVKI